MYEKDITNFFNRKTTPIHIQYFIFGSGEFNVEKCKDQVVMCKNTITQNNASSNENVNSTILILTEFHPKIISHDMAVLELELWSTSSSTHQKLTDKLMTKIPLTLAQQFVIGFTILEKFCDSNSELTDNAGEVLHKSSIRLTKYCRRNLHHLLHYLARPRKTLHLLRINCYAICRNDMAKGKIH